MAAHKKTDDTPDARMASAHFSKRREPRYTIPFDIEVSGIDANGQVFHQRRVTTNVSEWGCGFNSSVELKPDNIISIRLLAARDDDKSPPHDPAFFQVMRVERQGNTWSVGAWKMADGSVWGTELDKLCKPATSRLEARKDEPPADIEGAREKSKQ
jgi:hypothetical protein